MLFSIELYRKYLANSTTIMTRTNKIEKLNYELLQMKDILNGIPMLFSGDKSLMDKQDRTIYTLIKRNIISSIVNSPAGADNQVYLCSCSISDVINDIEAMREKEIA